MKLEKLQEGVSLFFGLPVRFNHQGQRLEVISPTGQIVVTIGVDKSGNDECSLFGFGSDFNLTALRERCSDHAAFISDLY